MKKSTKLNFKMENAVPPTKRSIKVGRYIGIGREVPGTYFLFESWCR